MITIDSDYVSYIEKTENKGMENIRTEDIFYIDSSSRQIIVPDSWTAVGTLQDHLAEKVWFAVDRFFDDRDFLVDSNQIMVNYINAASEGYVYNCKKCEDIYVWDPASNEVLEAEPGVAPTGDELQRYNKVLFAWRISQNVTKKTGKITFAVRIGKFTVDIEGSELQVDPEGQDWIWNTTIASLNVLESISSETGLDDEGNEWGIGDIARWFKSIAVAQKYLTAVFNLAGELERVAVGPRGNFQYTYYGSTAPGEYGPISTSSIEPPFVVNNEFQMITTAGTLRVEEAPWKYKLWVNTPTTPVADVLVPIINDGAPTTEDVWSSSKTSAVINNISTADRGYVDSKILATTADGGTTAAWASSPTTSYIQAQFGTSSATAATSGMSASAIIDYVAAQFTTTSSVSSSAGWTSSATKEYIDAQGINVTFVTDETTAPATQTVNMTYSDVENAIINNKLITANYTDTDFVESTGIPIEDINFYISKLAAVNINVDSSYFNGYTYSFLIENGYNSSDTKYAFALYLLKYDDFVLKGGMEDEHFNENPSQAYIKQIGGSSDNNGIGFKTATWNNGEIVAKICSYHNSGSSVVTDGLLTATSNASAKGSGTNQYMYSNGYINGISYIDTTFPNYAGQGTGDKIYIGSNTTLYRANTSSYQSYGSTLLGQITTALPGVIKLSSSNVITKTFINGCVHKISINNFIEFIFKDSGDTTYIGTVNNIDTIVRFNSDDTFTIIKTSGYMLTPTTSDIDKFLKYTNSGFEWQNIPTELPTVTSADAGKVLMVDSNGDWVVGNPS